MYGRVDRGCRRPWNKTLTKVVSERRKFQLIAQCQVQQADDNDDNSASCHDDADKLIVQCQEFLTGTTLLIRVSV